MIPGKLSKAEAGRLGARKRWGEQPRVVRLDELTNHERRLVIALIEAAKAADAVASSAGRPPSEPSRDRRRSPGIQSTSSLR